MTKFVAALFLPAILGLTALLVREHRRALARGWRTWALAAAFAVVLIAPWFVFASVRFGSFFWQTIVGVHVYERFTSALDPGHLHPWHYYLGQLVDFWETGALILVGGGVGLIAGWTTRRYAPSAIVLVIWLLPLLVISAVTSKLYHYAFPFLPPLALMGGYAAAIVPAVGWAPFDRALDRAYARAATRFPAVARVAQGRAVRIVLALAIAFCVVLAVGGLIFGRVELTFGNAELSSAGVLRPGLAAFVLGVVLMPSRRFRRWLLLLLVGSFLPLQGYRDSLALLGAGPHPRRSVSACIRAVQAADSQPGGIRVDEPRRDDQPLRLLLLRSGPAVAARSRCRRSSRARQVDGRFTAARRGARREHGADVAAAVCGLRKRGRPPVTDGARSDQRVDRRARVQRGRAD